MSDGLPSIHRTSLGGVPVFWSPVEGPLTVALSFRVGLADETLVSMGLTHLLEHLAMRRLTDAPYPCNATVQLLRTTFVARGSRDEVASFLQAVCQGLSEPPLELLDDERRILGVEASSRAYDGWAGMSATRYGPAGPGLGAYPEYGLHTADEESVAAWCRSRFVAENAALWLTGDPEGLPLDLPHGAAHPPADPAPLAQPLPAGLVGEPGEVLVEMAPERSLEVSIAIETAVRRAMARLRFGAGLAYAVDLRYEPVGPRLAQAGMRVPCGRGDEPEVLSAVDRILHQLADGGPETGELEDRVRERERGYLDPAAVPDILDEMVDDLLVRGIDQTISALHGRFRSVTREGVAEAMRRALATALVCAPPGVTLPDVPMRAGPEILPIAGERFPPSRGLNLLGIWGPNCLICGKEGVAVRRNRKIVFSMRFADCAAVVVSDDGRVLIGRDGRELAVRAGDWETGPRILRAIDESVAPSRFVVRAPATRPAPLLRYRP